MGRKLKNDELGRLNSAEFKRSRKNSVVIVLDNIRSMHNVGSAFRTADAFRIEKLLLCGVTATPPHREIEKTALGATAHVAWGHHSSTVEAVRTLISQGYSVYAIEQTEQSQMLGRVKFPPLCALVFGNEINGVDQEVIDLCTETVEIPQAGVKHSLNVSVTVGVVLWEILRDTFADLHEEKQNQN